MQTSQKWDINTNEFPSLGHPTWAANTDEFFIRAYRPELLIQTTIPDSGQPTLAANTDDYFILGTIQLEQLMQLIVPC